MSRGQPGHRLTTAHIQAAYPFVAEGGLGGRGVYIGSDLFARLPVRALPSPPPGLIPSPHMVVAARSGGKSALVKRFVFGRALGRASSSWTPRARPGARGFCGVAPLRLP